MKNIISCIIIALISNCMAAQSRTEAFEITLPTEKVSGSLYNRMGFIDSRVDGSNMGIIQKGGFNRKEKVVAKTPLSEQVTSVFKALKDSASGPGAILFQLRQLSFAEITGAMSEKGYCYFRAELYAFDGQRYKHLHHIDTVILVKSLDVTKAMFRNGSRVISDFIASGLVLKPTTNISLTLDQVGRIDSVEKSAFKLYTASTFTDGVYYSYSSFRDQIPDTQATVKLNRRTISSARIAGKEKRDRIKPKDVYAIVHEGKIFIATEYGFYPATKDGEDFFFIGQVKATAKGGDVMAAGFFFGILGSLIASDASSNFEMRIDHTNGGFVRLREAPLGER